MKTLTSERKATEERERLYLLQHFFLLFNIEAPFSLALSLPNDVVGSGHSMLLA